MVLWVARHRHRMLALVFNAPCLIFRCMIRFRLAIQQSQGKEISFFALRVGDLSLQCSMMLPSLSGCLSACPSVCLAIWLRICLPGKQDSRLVGGFCVLVSGIGILELNDGCVVHSVTFESISLQVRKFHFLGPRA